MNSNDRGGSFRLSVGFIILWVLLPLAAGYLLSLVVVPKPKIGIIRIQDEIWSLNVNTAINLLTKAKKDDTIKAVVLEIDSPGGEVAASESLYYEVLNLRGAKPVVASVDGMAASGAYYMAVAADFIYAKPSSLVGNIGVISFLPSPSFADEDLLFTGPFKFVGASRDSYIRQMEMSKEGFLEAVTTRRGERLKVDRQTLSQGEAYIGMRALDLGLIDSLGSISDAVEKAASQAGLTTYQVVEIGRVSPIDLWPDAGVSNKGQRLDSELPPGIYYLYLGLKERVIK